MTKCRSCGLITSLPVPKASGAVCGVAGCRGVLTRRPDLERRIADNIGDGRELFDAPRPVAQADDNRQRLRQLLSTAKTALAEASRLLG